MITKEEDLRIDKWLWAVRIFKTRSMASTACKKGRVLIDDQQVKPSHSVRVGSIVTVKKRPVFYKYRVLGLLAKRQSAKIASEYLEDITPEKEMQKLKVQKQVIQEHRPKGEGRPTKKERRELDKFKRKGL
ncbi:MAG TPA: S4 domain-containing protein [Bacteroidales bacterium]|nr:S4 domain-containing protein [Bacteroidales bacterium]